MTDNGFTPTQQRMLDVLADGLSHHRDELHACLPDELGAPSNISVHLSAIRRRLRPVGRDILCEWVRRQRRYRMVRLISQDE